MSTAAWRSRRAIFVLVCLFVLAAPGDLAARGGGGRGGGGGFGGGARGGGGSGGFSRGGAARNGSIGGYDRSRAGGGSRGSGQGSRASGQSGYGRAGESRSNSGSFENRRGESVDWESSVTRGEDGLTREGSWSSTSGASGSGSAKIQVKDGQVQGVDRSRQAENAKGETIERTASSERNGDWVEREGSVKTSTGVDAESAGVVKKTDDGFIAQGAVVGKEGAAAGTIVKDGGDVYARGAATDGDSVTYGRAHCSGGTCYGGTVKTDINHYYIEPYYYYPYYYGWYSCPYGSVQTWHSAYGTPIYGCSNVTVIHTTIALGPSSTTSSTSGSGSALPEAQVTSAPVLMYEVAPDVVVYATTYRPEGVYAEKQGTRFFWAPGPKKSSSDAKGWIEKAGSMPAPSANATVITYTIGKRIVYLTNERPAPGFFAESASHLFAWIPGVREPDEEELDTIRTAITAQRAGGQAALDREARKLETSREPPPASDTPPAS